MFTNNKNVARARESAGNVVQLINVDTLDPSIPAENPRLFISPEAIAYILCTSGSTGQPKGVVQSHRNVLGMIMHHTNLFHVCAEDRVVLLYPTNSELEELWRLPDSGHRPGPRADHFPKGHFVTMGDASNVIGRLLASWGP